MTDPIASKSEIKKQVKSTERIAFRSLDNRILQVLYYSKSYLSWCSHYRIRYIDRHSASVIRDDPIDKQLFGRLVQNNDYMVAERND